MKHHLPVRVAMSALAAWTFCPFAVSPASAAGSAPVIVLNESSNPVPVRLESGASVGIEAGSDPIPVEIQANFFESDAVPVRETVVGDYRVGSTTIDCPAEGEPPDLTYTCPLQVGTPTGPFGISGGRLVTIAVQDRTQDPDVQAALFLHISTDESSFSIYLGRLERTGVGFPLRALTREVNLPDARDGATFEPFVVYTRPPNAHQVSVQFVRVEHRGRLEP